MLKRFLFSWLVNFLGLWAASELFSSIQYGGKLRFLIIASAIFGIVNALVRPIVVILSLPAIVLTFGLFTLVVNTLMLYVTSFFYPTLQINSRWSAFGAVIIVWLVNYLMTDLIVERKERA